MARSDHEVRVDPSVLDRLIDDAQLAREPRVAPDSEAGYRESVRRDLEFLLNTRNPYSDLEPEFQEVAKSALCYGLPDFSTLKIGSPSDQRRLKELIERAFKLFEPRLKDVTVTISRGTEAERSVHIGLEAKLEMAPTAKRVTVDIVRAVGASRWDVSEIR